MALPKSPPESWSTGQVGNVCYHMEAARHEKPLQWVGLSKMSSLSRLHKERSCLLSHCARLLENICCTLSSTSLMHLSSISSPKVGQRSTAECKACQSLIGSANCRKFCSTAYVDFSVTTTPDKNAAFASISVVEQIPIHL